MCFRSRLVETLLLASLLTVSASVHGATQDASPSASLDQALQSLQAGESERAQEMLEEIVARWPKYGLAHYHLGRVAFERGDLELARTHLSEATEGQFPRAFSAWYYLGRVLVRQDSLQSAVEAFGKAIDLAPAFAPAYLERGRARLALGDDQAAVRDLLQITGMPDAPHDTRTRARRLLRESALAAEERDDLWLAMEIYQRLLDDFGSMPAIESRLAGVAQTMGAVDLARCAARRTLAADPDNPAIWYLLAAVEADRGDVKAAIEACQRSRELGNEDVRMWLKLGELYFEQMKIDESIAAYSEAMARDPRAAEAVRSFALSSLTTEQYESLRQVLEAHIQANPENLNTLYSLGVMSLRDNDLVEAERHLQRLAELAPDHRQVHYSLGQLYMRQGDTARGQAEMQRFAAIKQAEDDEWNHHNQAHFRRVEAGKAMTEGRPEEAIPLFEQSITEGTAKLEDYLELAAAYLAAGRAAEALKACEGVLASHPYNRDALQGLSDAAEALGDSGKLAEARRKLTILEWPCGSTAGREVVNDPVP